MKELHIWLRWPTQGDLPPQGMLYLDGAESLLRSGAERVDTVQAHYCSTVWLQMGYRLFVHFSDGTDTEIKLGSNHPRRAISGPTTTWNGSCSRVNSGR